MLPVAAEFSDQIPQPPFSKAVRNDGGLALVDILQRVMQQQFDNVIWNIISTPALESEKMGAF